MAEDRAEHKLVDALNEVSDAVIDRMRAANDRRHRLSTAFIEQAQESRRDTFQLAKKWAEAPFDLFGLYGSVVQTTTKAQGRALDAARQWFGEIADAQKETRETLRRVFNANRSATDATVGFARGVVSRAGAAVQSAADGNGRSAEQAAAASAETSESSETGGDPEY